MKSATCAVGLAILAQHPVRPETIMVHRRRLLLWFPLFGVTLIALLTQSRWEGVWLADWMGVPFPFVMSPTIALAVFVAAVLCEYMDTSLGMGFGTIMTPVLLIAGFEPLDIVPAVLFSELLTGLAAGLLHQRDGNIDLVRDRRARRTLILLAALSGAGAIAAVLLAVQIDARWFAYGSAALMLAMGAMTLATARRSRRFRVAGIFAVGVIAAFSKGLSGGGYGPLVTSGQVVCGVPVRQAVAITSIAEGLTCLVILMGYLAVKGAPDWGLSILLAAGALLAVPWATLAVRCLPEGWLRMGVGLLTVLLGMVSLVKLLG